MADDKKNKKLRSVPKDIVPLDEQSWILQPITVSMMRYDYDVVQSRALVAIMKEMQDAIKAVVYNQARPEDQLQLFSSNDFISKFGKEEINPDNEIVLKIPLRKFGSDKRRYDTLKSALRQLATIPVEIPIRSLNEDGYDHISSLCEVYIPNQSYTKDVYIKIKRKVALRMIDNKMGTHKYLEQVMFETKNKYVQRIYPFISAWRNQKATCIRTVKQIRHWLCLENKYPRWDMFYSCVLKKAEDELYTMAQDGRSDIYFTIKRIYNDGNEVGEPDKLQFFIHKSEACKMCEGAESFRVQKKGIADFCNYAFGIKGVDLRSILEHITEENIDKLNSFLAQLDEREQKALENGKIDKLHRHAYTCIMRKLLEWESEDTKALSDFALGDEAEEIVSHETSSEDKKLWDSVWSSLTDEQRIYKDAIKVVEVNDSAVVISYPSRTTYEMVSREFGTLIQDRIGEKFGKRVEVRIDN